MTRDNSNNKLRAVFLAALMFLWLFAGTVAFAGGAAAGSADPVTVNLETGQDNFDGEEFNQGQEVRILVDTELNDETLQLREVTERDGSDPVSSTRRASRTVENGEVTFRTANLPEGEYLLQERADNRFYEEGSPGGTTGAAGFDGDIDTADEASVVVQTLNVDFDDDEVRAGDDVELQFETEREGGEFDVNITEDNLDAEELESIFNDLENNGADTVERFDGDDVYQLQGVDSFFENDVTFSDDIDTGDYDFSFNVTDTTAEDNASITVLEELDPDASFGQGVYDQNRGDVVNISVDADRLDDGENVQIVFGDLEDANLEISFIAEPEDGEDLIFQINTFSLAQSNGDYAAGDTSDPDDEGITVSEGNIVGHIDTNGDLDEDGEINVTTDTEKELERVIDSGLYDIAVEQDPDAISEPEELDVAAVEILDNELGDITMHVSPNRDFGDLDNKEDFYELLNEERITVGDEVAIGDTDESERRGDVAVAAIDVSGIYGAALSESGETDFEDGDALFEALLDNDNFAELNFTQTNPRQNRGPTRLALGEQPGVASSVTTGTPVEAPTYLFDNDNNTLFISVRTSDLDDEDVRTSGDTIRSGDNYEYELTLTDSYYSNFQILEEDFDSENTNTTLDMVDREATFDTVNDNVTVSPTDDAVISGETTVAPGTELNVRARATGESPFLRNNQTRVTPDGEFSGTFDFSNVDDGQTFTASIRQQAFDDDAETPGVVGELEGPVFTVSDLEPQDATVDQGDLIDVSATITNDGDENGTQDVALTLDGDELDSQEIELDAGEDTTVEFTDVDTSALDEGTYEHGIETENDSATGTLTIEVEDEPEPTDDEETPAPTDDEEPTDDEPDPDDQAGFGAVIALVALLGAALLATRRNIN